MVVSRAPNIAPTFLKPQSCLGFLRALKLERKLTLLQALDRTDKDGEEVFSAVSNYEDEEGEEGEAEIYEGDYLQKLKTLTPEEIRQLKEEGLLPEEDGEEEGEHEIEEDGEEEFQEQDPEQGVQSREDEEEEPT